jgi:CRP-like cAMP-binding protein
MDENGLGKIYRDTEIIIKQGDQGDCMFVIQEGLVEIVKEMDGGEVLLALRGAGEFFGEMAIFEHEVRSATARALGEVRALTIDKKNLLRRIHEDPSMAFHLVQSMSARIRELSNEIAEIKLTQNI